MASFLVGNSVEIVGTFTDINDVLVDPTVVTLQVMQPSGAVTSFTYGAGYITRVSIGVYAYTFAPAVGGNWTFRWAGTGTLPVAAEGAFTILSSGFVAGS